MGYDGRPVGEARVASPSTISAEPVTRDAAQYLVGTEKSNGILAIVHRPEEIEWNFGSDARRALRLALCALEEDPGQLEALLKLTKGEGPRPCT